MIRLEHPALDPLDLDDRDGFVCEELDLGAPVTRSVSESRPRADGTIDDTAYFGARAVSVTLAVFDGREYTRRQNLDRLAAYCHPGLRPTLTFSHLSTDEPRQVTLRAEQFSAPLNSPDMTRVMVSWVVPSGRIESARVNVVVTIPGSGDIPGWSPPLEPPLVFPHHTSPQALVSVGGSVPSEWRASIYGPITSPAILNHTTGETLVSFPGLTIAAGDHLRLYQADRVAWLNSEPGASRYHLLDFAASSWAPLGVGGQMLELAAESSAPPASLWLQWRDTYLI